MKNYFVPSTRLVLHRNLGPSGMALLNQGLDLQYPSIAMVYHPHASLPQLIQTSFHTTSSEVITSRSRSSEGSDIRKSSDQMSQACKANRLRFVSFLVGFASRSCGFENHDFNGFHH